MINSTHSRVPANTSRQLNQRIELAMDTRLQYYARHPQRIPARLTELDREWDIERMLETGSSCLTLGGLVLSVTHCRRWLLLSAGVQAFFLQHALQGWCPPLPVLRKLGFRTPDEINQERHALIAMQQVEGDVGSRLAQGRLQAETASAIM